MVHSLCQNARRFAAYALYVNIRLRSVQVRVKNTRSNSIACWWLPEVCYNLAVALAAVLPEMR
jgi:hypothetical protein